MKKLILVSLVCLLASNVAVAFSAAVSSPQPNSSGSVSSPVPVSVRGPSPSPISIVGPGPVVKCSQYAKFSGKNGEDRFYFVKDTRMPLRQCKQTFLSGAGGPFEKQAVEVCPKMTDYLGNPVNYVFQWEVNGSLQSPVYGSYPCPDLTEPLVNCSQYAHLTGPNGQKKFYFVNETKMTPVQCKQSFMLGAGGPFQTTAGQVCSSIANDLGSPLTYNFVYEINGAIQSPIYGNYGCGPISGGGGGGLPPGSGSGPGSGVCGENISTALEDGNSSPRTYSLFCGVTCPGQCSPWSKSSVGGYTMVHWDCNVDGKFVCGADKVNKADGTQYCVGITPCK